jgi:predicted nucleic acid-binding protein
MNGNIVFDSNIIIGFLNKYPNFPNLSAEYADKERYISIVTKLELLGFPGITVEQENDIYNFLDDVSVVPLTESIERETIAIRRVTRLKLPDAIIAATAIVLDVTLISRDDDLLNCTYPKLRVWRDSPEGAGA